MVFLGHVRWFNGHKGYGFVRLDGMEDDVFVHHSVIQMRGFRNLQRGQRVELELGYCPRGLIATRLVPMSLDLRTVKGEA